MKCHLLSDSYHFIKNTVMKSHLLRDSYHFIKNTVMKCNLLETQNDRQNQGL